MRSLVPVTVTDDARRIDAETMTVFDNGDRILFGGSHDGDADHANGKLTTGGWCKMSKTKMNIASGSQRPTVLFVAALVQVAIMLSHPALAKNKQSSPVSIEANVSLEWDQTRGVYTAIGNAVVEQDDKRLKADKSLPVTTCHKGRT